MFEVLALLWDVAPKVHLDTSSIWLISAQKTTRIRNATEKNTRLEISSSSRCHFGASISLVYTSVNIDEFHTTLQLCRRLGPRTSSPWQPMDGASILRPIQEAWTWSVLLERSQPSRGWTARILPCIPAHCEVTTCSWTARTIKQTNMYTSGTCTHIANEVQQHRTSADVYARHCQAPVRTRYLLGSASPLETQTRRWRC